MRMTNQIKAAVNASNGIRDPLASQGARRASAEADGSTMNPAIANVEVVAHPRRRRFSNAQKRRILAEAERCTEPGAIGALLRREGLYSSSLSTWRRQLAAADLTALAPQKRGPKPDPERADVLQIAKLTRENDRLRNQLEKARLVIDVQKKVAALLGHTLDDNGEKI
jgi:transposase